MKHRAGRWATAVYVAVGDKFFIVESDKKLEGHLNENFLQMIEELVTSEQ